MKTTLTAITTAILLSLSVGAMADQDDARKLREAGDIKPLTSIINENEQLRDARILEAEFEHEHGRHAYEIEYIDSEGHHRKGYFDAVTGEPLKSKYDE